MEQITHLLESIKLTLIFIAFCVFVYSWLAIVDTAKHYIYEAASFSKYIEIDSIVVHNAQVVDWKLLFDSDTNRVVKLRSSYDVNVTKELECWTSDNLSVRWTVKETWLLESEGNPWVKTKDIKNEFRVSSGDVCYIRYSFDLEVNGYIKEFDIVSNIFTIQ